jgi:hypothetical protein
VKILLCAKMFIEGIGEVLNQNGHGICFESQKLKECVLKMWGHEALPHWWKKLNTNKTEGVCIENVGT